MQRAPVTVEEQLLQKAIKDECTWENLPKRLQATLTSKEEWHRRIIESCIKKRLQWNSCFAHKVCKESEYYEQMMRYMRKNLAVCTVLNFISDSEVVYQIHYYVVYMMTDVKLLLPKLLRRKLKLMRLLFQDRFFYNSK
ncbi:hypothetical protein Fmac_032939 [Flemingia macrophylla]|uniref:FAM91 N-terminal domain-containing protein n=1 Tax=Flemingia macrophylla TaxID=520843 RepID=A0ABD1L6C6_9FABA